MSIWSSFVPGTAINVEASGGDESGSSGHMAKAQKFRVFVVRECRIHGCLRSVVASSTGSWVEKVSSSAGRSCHTRR